MASRERLARPRGGGGGVTAIMPADKLWELPLRRGGHCNQGGVRQPSWRGIQGLRGVFPAKVRARREPNTVLSQTNKMQERSKSLPLAERFERASNASTSLTKNIY